MIEWCLGLGVFAVLVMLVLFVLWVYTLIRQVGRKQWVWFVLTLLSGIALIVYWILVMTKEVK